jgi:hypothetical protein
MSNCYPIRDIPIRFIRTNGATQARVAMDQGAIHDYADAMKEGARFPPVTLFQDADVYWLGDGFHRVEAYQLSGKKNAKAEIRPGGLREAQLFAIGANHAHGLRRTNSDKRKAVSLLLDDPEWGAWSAREIAQVAGVSHFLVETMKGERLALNATPKPPRAPEKAATLPPLPDELVQFDTWDDQDAEDTFSSRLYALESRQSPNPKSFLPWDRLWQSNPKDAFTRLLVAEAREEVSDHMLLPTEAERDEWLSGFAPAPPRNIQDLVQEMEAGATEQVCGVSEPTRPVTPNVDEAQLHPAAPVKAAPLPPGPDDRDSRIVQLEHLVEAKDAEIAELTRKLEEAGAQVQELADENASMHRILDAEDLLKSFKEEVVRAQALARTTEERVRGMQNQNKALAKSAESWKGKFDRLQKKTKGTPVPEPDPELEDDCPYPPLEV